MTGAPLTVEALAGPSNPLARHYARFRVAERLLLTGHSHQAWPDVAFDGQVEAWNAAAELVDGKWGRAAAKADRVRLGYARLLGDEGAAPDRIALGPSTHDLLVRFLSALPLVERPQLVTTDGEFHTIRRQLGRLAETGAVEVVKVASNPAASIAEQLATAVNERTAAVLASSVLFSNAHIVPGLGTTLERCRAAGAEMLVDAYHHLNVVPFSIAGEQLEEAFVIGGGYKYCQLGEGNCFLRVPPGREGMRPVVTGWYAEFERLSARPGAEVFYGAGATRWAGATYDPTSHYRAARVFDFFDAQGLAPELLRAVSRRQVGRLAERFDALDLDPKVVARDRDVPLDRIGGFLALRSPRAAELCERLRARGVSTDARGDLLRLGPAPYLSDDQLDSAMVVLAEVARGR